MERGWTQRDLAARIRRSQGTISMVESGQMAASPVLLRDLERVFQGEPPLGSPPPPQVSFSLPEISPERGGLASSPVRFSTWRRPEASGDFHLLIPFSRESLLIAAVDVAGHGLSVLPTALFLQGWLLGWARAQISPPRLETLVEEFSLQLLSAKVDAACYFALISWAKNRRHVASYEAVAHGFPSPLLIVGDSPATPQSTAQGPPLPVGAPVPPMRIDRLSPPWRLAVASDGLLSRLGEGNEGSGLRVLREWQSGSKRDEVPERHLDTPIPVIDDESFLLLTWDGWDFEVTFAVHDDAERHRAIRTVGQRAWQALVVVEQALVEALDNVRRHAYLAGTGPVKVRCREEEAFFRVEIEDEGRDQVTQRQVRAAQSGFAIMRQFAVMVDVRQGPRSGTIVSLALAK